MKAIQSIYLVGLVSIMGLFCIKLAQAFPDKALNSNSFNEENSSLDNFESSFSPIECIDMCFKYGSLASRYCNCVQLAEVGAKKPKRHYPIDCQVLCFIGQGGKACNCNYAPFVGK